ncbi:RES family NAD+ phosphorylase [Vreelandella olivaria]|uniref:RES family NAD+ phosphorylase n=1 Tax=Vreelandella olivaria TaxID=390919 RepID=UPI00201F8441
MTGYRLIKKRWVGNAFDGEGARLYGGRWNSKGTPCVYLASSESLAMLEVMVHLEDYNLLQRYTLFAVTFNESAVLSLPDDELPKDWQAEPAPESTSEIGDGWLASLSSLVLVVPSVVVPREVNYLLNPAHPDFEGIVTSAKEIGFSPDPRLTGD